MNCPICNAPELEPGAITCPECLSELEGFELIRKTDSECVQLNKDLDQQRSRNKMLIIILILLVIVLAVTFVMRGSDGSNEQASTDPATEITDETASLIEELATIKSENEQLKTEMANAKKELDKADEDNPVKEAAPTETEEIDIEGETSQTSTTDNSIPSTHTLAKGESIWKLAVQYYGNGMMFTKIVEANSLDNPDVIAPGTVINLPPK
ncbi:MAG TPA: LysM peptidoglycan-binding domain-containing protein [Deltaproteobacteria bacterium]|nr:LysM peptidoglycan-binding domain-containing protein [Deltaproteobacteria bacterium]